MLADLPAIEVRVTGHRITPFLARFEPWPEPRLIEFYRVGPHRLWGASYRILQPLLPRLLAGEWTL